MTITYSINQIIILCIVWHISLYYHNYHVLLIAAFFIPEIITDHIGLTCYCIIIINHLQVQCSLE